MPSADRPGDPFEGTTPHGELERWKREALNAADTDEKRRIIEYNRSSLSRMAQMFRDHYYYVGCWHMNRHENGSMWGCYNKPGICRCQDDLCRLTVSSSRVR